MLTVACLTSPPCCRRIGFRPVASSSDGLEACPTAATRNPRVLRLVTTESTSAAAADRSATARRTVLLFAAAREAVGADCLELTLPDQATARTALSAIAAAAPQLSGLLPACRLAVDRQFVGDDFLLPADAELALIPPVSGG